MDLITALRKYRIFNMAIFDFTITILVIFMIHLYMWRNASLSPNTKNNRTYLQYFISLSLFIIGSIWLGVMVHYILGVKSQLSFYLGFNDEPIYKNK
jgi:hypothetical protein